MQKECTSAIFVFFYVCTQRASHPHPLASPTATVKLASDWLSVDLDDRALCYWTSTQMGKNRKTEVLQYLNIAEYSVGTEGMAGAN
jgi:hypothetical protein